MYPIKFKKLLDYMVKNNNNRILFLSCISFEPRCRKAIRILNNYGKELDIVWVFFQIVDNGSEFELECLNKQELHEEQILKDLNLKLDIPKILLFNPAKKPHEFLITYYKEKLEKHPEINTIIIDLSTIPKIVYFSFLKWLLDKGIKDNDLIICYTKPGEYNSEFLETEPQDAETLIGIHNRKKKDIIWIPSLGFKSEFTEILSNYIQNLNPNSVDIKPILGFPSYRPDFYDKSLLCHLNTFKDNKKFKECLRERSFFTSASDPFEIYQRLKEIYLNNPLKEIILSPGGTKPISLGLALFAIKYNLPNIIMLY